jgi:hypothetical protein
MSVSGPHPTSRAMRAAGVAAVPWRRLLLACGMIAPPLWVGMDVVASLRYDGYSYVDQTISELSAIGAPTRSFWFALGIPYNLLVIAFAAGVWQSAGRSRALRVAAVLLAVPPLISLVLAPFSSMHQREVLAAGGATVSDTLHLVITGIGVFTFLVVIACAMSAFGRRFRIYSVATITAMLVFGTLTSLYAAEVESNQPTPGVGLYERINAHGYMLWVVVFAVMLMRRENSTPREITAR